MGKRFAASWGVMILLLATGSVQSITIQDQSGLAMILEETGEVSSLKINGMELLNSNEFSGIELENMIGVQADNLLENGSFESWPDCNLYLHAENYPDSEITRGGGDPVAEDGSYCLKFTGSGSFEISKSLSSFEPNTPYVMTAWVYPSSDCGNFHIQAGLQDWTWNGMNHFSQDNLVKGQWNKIQINYTTGVSLETLLMEFLITGSDTGYIAVDNIVVSASRGEVTGGVTQTACGAVLTGEILGIEVVAEFTQQSSGLAINVSLHDLTGQDRAIRAKFVLNLNDLGWIWCHDLNRYYTAESGVWNMNPGTYAGHIQSAYPFSAIATPGGVGLAMGWPMSNPRFYTECFTLQDSGIGNFVLFADLGLTSETAKFPSSADFDVILYRFDGQNKFRGALAQYYQIYPDFFEYSFDKKGFWTLWLGEGVETLAQNAGVVYHESEFDLCSDAGVSMLTRDDEWGFMSLQYTEPWGYWYPMPAGFDDQNTNFNITPESYEIVLHQEALYNYIAGDLGSTAVSDRFPGTTRGEVAQAVINTAAWRAPDGNWMCHYYNQGGFMWGSDRYGWDSVALIANPDPDLPSPNRWDIAWTGQVEYVANAGASAGATLDGVYLDSMCFGLALDRMDFCRDHWRVADIPLTYTTLSNGQISPAQALILADVEFLKKMKSECEARNWAILGNGFFPVYAIVAPWLDVLGAGEIVANPDGTIHTIDQAILGYFRAMAYGKPVSIMDYSLSLFGLASTQENVDNIVEPRINYDLFYGIYPGTANCWRVAPDTLEKLNLVVPVFQKYRPLFQAINTVGWEPVTLATVDQSDVLIERWGNHVQQGLYLTLYNSSDSNLAVGVTIDLDGLHCGTIESARELVTETVLSVTSSGSTASFNMTIDAGRTALVYLGSEMTGIDGNLISNGSFELGTNEWYMNSENYPDTHIDLISENPMAQDGTKCVKVTGSGFSEISQTARNVLPNTTYALTAWIYPSGNCPDSVLIQAGFHGVAMENYYVNESLTKGQWNEVKILYTTGSESETLLADFMFWLNNDDTEIAVDRIKVEAVPSPSQNASFEIPETVSITIDGNLSDWPEESEWSEPFIVWNVIGLDSTTKAKFAWNDATDLLYIAVQTDESSSRAGGHPVIGVAMNKDDEAYTGLGTTQLGFDFKPATGSVLVTNEINYYSTAYGVNWPGASSGTNGISAACRLSGGVYTYEIAIPLWKDWTTMTEKESLSWGETIYVYAIMESMLASGIGMNMTYDGNPDFAFENGFYAGATLIMASGDQIAGDANGDGGVDVGDLGILAANYGMVSGATWSQGDFNGDGAVDVGDLGILAANYGTNVSGADFEVDYAKIFGTVSEPTAMDDATDESIDSSICSSLGLPLVAGLLLIGLRMMKLDNE